MRRVLAFLAGFAMLAVAPASHARAVVSAPSPGQLFAFGDNSAGQLGNATNNGSFAPNSTPAIVGLPGAIGAVIHVVSGDSWSMAVTTTGQLYAFGANPFGQLGISTNRGTANPNVATGTISGTPTRAGAYTPTVMVTDNDQINASRPLTIAVGLPALSALAVSPHRFSTAGRILKRRCVAVSRGNRHRRRCTRPFRVRITFTLTGPASVTLTLQRAATGRLVSGRCVAITRRNRKRRHCARLSQIRAA